VTALLALLLSLAPQATQPGAPAPPPALSVAMSARSVRPGELVVLTITVPEHTDAVTVTAFDNPVTAFKVDDRTWKALVGIDLTVAPRRYAVAIEARGASAPAKLTHRLQVTARTFRTRRLTVDANFVNPPASETARIERETRALAALWNDSSPRPLWSGAFMRPVPGAANSAFGTRSIYNGQPRSPHSGGDFVGAEGDPIKAPGGGRVVMAEHLYFSGNTIVIDHGAGLFSLLAHMSEMGVKTGDTVNSGDVIGKVGATGRVTGPHLHWAVRANGGRVDPLSLLAVL
jgi:murein DD-endopeptidase MepM/ murein hydrolase activator NlpD